MYKYTNIKEICGIKKILYAVIKKNFFFIFYYCVRISRNNFQNTVTKHIKKKVSSSKIKNTFFILRK